MLTPLIYTNYKDLDTAEDSHRPEMIHKFGQADDFFLVYETTLRSEADACVGGNAENENLTYYLKAVVSMQFAHILRRSLGSDSKLKGASYCHRERGAC